MTFVPATYWDGGDVSDTLDVAGLTKGQMMPEKRRFPVVMQTLTATNDPSRSPQSSEVTQQVETLTRAGAGVRRLTPTECERLQGLEDGWTLPGSDLKRYAGLGDAVTANVAEWIGRRLMEAKYGYAKHQDGQERSREVARPSELPGAAGSARDREAPADRPRERQEGRQATEGGPA